MLGYVHAYDSERRSILAKRDAALAMQPPFGCLQPGDWQTLGWAQTAQYTFYSQEDSCALYLERTNVNTWPNPIMVLTDTLLVMPLRTMERVADSLALALHTFLSHFSWSMQSYLLLLLPIGIVCTVWLWPILALWSNALRLAIQPRTRRKYL